VCGREEKEWRTRRKERQLWKQKKRNQRKKDGRGGRDILKEVDLKRNKLPSLTQREDKEEIIKKKEKIIQTST
jgi:hypothetical protein